MVLDLNAWLTSRSQHISNSPEVAEISLSDEVADEKKNWLYRNWEFSIFLSKAQRAALGHLRSLEKHGDIRALSGTTITQRVLLASKEKPWMKCYFHFNRQAAKYLFGIFT